MQKFQPHQVMLRCPALREKTGRSNSSTYEDIAAGLMTPPVKIGLRASAWPQHEIDAVIAARIAGKSHDEIRALVKQLVAARKLIDGAAT